MKIFNVIDKPELNFKPIVSFVKDVSNKKTSKIKVTKKSTTSFVIDMNSGDGDNVGDGDD